MNPETLQAAEPTGAKRQMSLWSDREKSAFIDAYKVRRARDPLRPQSPLHVWEAPCGIGLHSRIWQQRCKVLSA